mmetsp:Transcript_89619/g.208753  ORF Transcript_89619/g.208753 Transcript_89619/m.208753 type:complete len:259 (+) Transcript_89619:837-1613(+)
MRRRPSPCQQSFSSRPGPWWSPSGTATAAGCALARGPLGQTRRTSMSSTCPRASWHAGTSLRCTGLASTVAVMLVSKSQSPVGTSTSISTPTAKQSCRGRPAQSTCRLLKALSSSTTSTLRSLSAKPGVWTPCSVMSWRSVPITCSRWASQRSTPTVILTTLAALLALTRMIGIAFQTRCTRAVRMCRPSSPIASVSSSTCEVPTSSRTLLARPRSVRPTLPSSLSWTGSSTKSSSTLPWASINAFPRYRLSGAHRPT